MLRRPVEPAPREWTSSVSRITSDKCHFGSGRCALDALAPSEATTRTPHLLQTDERELICDGPRSSQTQEPPLDAKPRQAEDEPDYLKELLAQAGIDAQASSVAAKLQEVVIGELHHRMKNTLAIVSAITSQSLKSANSIEEATKTIGERLHALGVAQDLLVSERWTGAGCRTLIEGAVKAFQSKSLDQFEIAGDNIAVSSGPAISLSMVIHELCTNAVKHGALSAPNGRVLISWAVSEDHPPRFQLHWKERGGPPVREPSRKSFGSRLIEQALPGHYRARLDLDLNRMA